MSTEKKDNLDRPFYEYFPMLPNLDFPAGLFVGSKKEIDSVEESFWGLFQACAEYDQKQKDGGWSSRLITDADAARWKEMYYNYFRLYKKYLDKDVPPYESRSEENKSWLREMGWLDPEDWGWILDQV